MPSFWNKLKHFALIINYYLYQEPVCIDSKPNSFDISTRSYPLIVPRYLKTSSLQEITRYLEHKTLLKLNDKESHVLRHLIYFRCFQRVGSFSTASIIKIKPAMLVNLLFLTNSRLWYVLTKLKSQLFYSWIWESGKRYICLPHYLHTVSWVFRTKSRF